MTSLGFLVLATLDLTILLIGTYCIFAIKQKKFDGLAIGLGLDTTLSLSILIIAI